MDFDITFTLPPDAEETMWAALLELAPPSWTASVAARIAGCETASINHYLQRLVRAGYAQRERLTRRKIAHYRLIRRPKLAPRLNGDGTPSAGRTNEQLWRAIRMAKSFSAEELATACVGVSGHMARRYCAELARAGILTGDAEGFRLVRDLGPRAPKLITVSLVLEPNSGQLVGWPDAREVQP